MTKFYCSISVENLSADVVGNAFMAVAGCKLPQDLFGIHFDINDYTEILGDATQFLTDNDLEDTYSIPDGLDIKNFNVSIIAWTFGYGAGYRLIDIVCDAIAIEISKVLSKTVILQLNYFDRPLFVYKDGILLHSLSKYTENRDFHEWRKWIPNEKIEVGDKL